MEKVYRCDDQVVFTQLNEDEAVLLHLVSKRYYSLNETGTRIWKYLEQRLSDKEIADELASEYDVELKNVLSYVKEFLDDLENEKLIIVDYID